MATDMSKALATEGTHGVGNLHSHNPSTLNHGALVVDAPIDNYTIGELGFTDGGERSVKQLSAKTNKGVLVASPERRYLGEGMSEFYNDIGDRARIINIQVGETRFDSSSYELNTSVTEVKAGQVAHFSVAKKKFIISESASAHADYATSALQLVVVSNETTELDGKEMVRLEVTKV